MKKTYLVLGMTCSACVSHVEKAVNKVQGVKKCVVNLVTNMLKVEGDFTDQDIIKAVEGAGYRIQLEDKDASKQKKDVEVTDKAVTKEYIIRLVVSFGFMIPLMYVAMSHMFSWPLPSFLAGQENAVLFALTQLLLCLPVIYVNRSYYINGYKRLFKLAPNMDTLIAIGSSAALIYGIIAIFMIGYGLGHGDMAMVDKYTMDMYFESAAMILSLITLGKFFEYKAKNRTKGALSKLIDLKPSNVTLLREGKEVVVSIDQVAKGDLIVIRPGDRLPVDGVVVEGYGVIDQSAVTGESLPVNKGVGEEVISGTISVDSRFVYKAVNVGEETTISKIIELMENAQATKAPIQKLADKVSSVFVPIVISIAVLTFIVWLAVGREFSFALALGIAVLVISCPCALGLATPLAIMVGTGLGAERGVLYKSAESIERLGKVNVVIFDKTGTITTGKPQVTKVLTTDGVDEKKALGIMSAVESGSRHPLATAIRQYVGQQGIEDNLEVTDYKSIAGKGVIAIIDGEMYICGNASLLKDYGIDSATLDGGVGIKMYLASKEKLLMLVMLEDTIKESSAKAIAELNKRKIHTVLLTGDNKETAERIGKLVGVSEVIADVLPSQKDEVVKKYQAEGKVVAMCGDGINDSIALVRSDVGFAVAHGSDVAIESADIVLMKNEPYDLVHAVDISKKTIRTIRFNLFWAFVYNALGIPLAAGVFYPAFQWTLNPMIAAAAMSCSSLFVVGNTLFLKVTNMLRKDRSARKGKKKEMCEQVCPLTLNAESEQDNMQNINKQKEAIMEIKVKGMMCSHCTGHVEKALRELGLGDVVASVEKENVSFTNENGLELDKIKQAIVDAGYEVVD